MGFSRQEYWSGVPLPSLSDHLEHNKRGGRGPRNGIYFFGAEDKKLGLLGFLSVKDREGNGIPLQYSCLENLVDGGAW